jgi:hypothetical protein
MNQDLLQCLGVTADNTSPNDVMIDELMDMLPNFPGQANQTLNLTLLPDTEGRNYVLLTFNS